MEASNVFPGGAGRSYEILAIAEITDPNASGVIFARGSRFGGHAFFLKGKKLSYVYNFLRIKPEQALTSSVLFPGRYTFGFEFVREKAGQYHISIGTGMLDANDKFVAQDLFKTQPGTFTLSGDGLCVGCDSGDNVSQEYRYLVPSQAVRSRP
jgi:arylsulfatase